MILVERHGFIFCRKKSEAFISFKSFKALVEKETGCSIKILRTNRGGEYLLQEFINFCESHGICRQLTTAYTPQQNRIFLVLFEHDTEKKLGVENNRDVQHLKAFGCIAFAHVLDRKEQSLMTKPTNVFFLVLARVKKPTCLTIPYRSVIIGRGCGVCEDNFWPWEEKPNNQQLPLDLDDGYKEQEQPVADIGASTLVHQEGISSQPQRNRKQPTWMADYEVRGRDKSGNDDSLIYLALFPGCDPVRFEDASKDLKWQKAMDVEIATIEKKKIWELR
ncbi:uncharacterized protein LOC132039456 [Lycium ferocissimum]|uniref:uncharacterized protein LOC132039456 n=1 Tax=Lycium ferocissimum TaxID=112874 RepID=UPI0028160F5A|nr:uncharacterized protein LOC132039456 [Lycium ferocissimum]